MGNTWWSCNRQSWRSRPDNQFSPATQIIAEFQGRRKIKKLGGGSSSAEGASAARGPETSPRRR